MVTMQGAIALMQQLQRAVDGEQFAELEAQYPALGECLRSVDDFLVEAGVTSAPAPAGASRPSGN